MTTPRRLWRVSWTEGLLVAWLLYVIGFVLSLIDVVWRARS
jgi:hypothetical protein